MIPRVPLLSARSRVSTAVHPEKPCVAYARSNVFQFPRWLGLVLLLLCGARTDAQVYFGHCFSKLEQADVDLNGELTAEEYGSFAVAYTESALELPVPPVVLEPFQTLSSTNGGVIPIAGIKATDPASQGTVIQLCHKVKTALMSHYGVATEWDSCIGALKAGDQDQPAGFLGPEQEFAVFITSLSGGSVSTVTSLTKIAYDDMAVDGMIAGPKGGEYLMEFCQRVDLALSIEATRPVAATLAPTLSPTSLSAEDSNTGTPTLTPTAGHSEAKETSKVQVVQANTLPQVQFELTEPVFQQCLKDLLLTDINRNDLLERKEYTRFVNRLHNEVFQSDIHDDAVDGTDRAFLDILSDQGKRVVPSIYGAKPGQTPSRAEEKMLRFVCQTSHEMIRNVHKADSGVESAMADDTDQDSGDSEDDFDKFYRTCKVSLFVADRNKDSKVDQEEFAKMINRITPKASDKFRELDDVFQRGFRHASTGGSIKVSGSSPAVQPTLMETSHLQFVCRDIKKSIDDFDKKQDDLEVSNHLQVRNNNIEEQFPDLSEEFFRTCTMGMFIADEDRDARLSSPEFFNLIDRLSFGDLEANSYADLHPVFKASHDTCSDDDGFIDIQGSKPGLEPNYDEEMALRRICNLLDGAIADVQEEELERKEAEASRGEEDVATSPPARPEIEPDVDENLPDTPGTTEGSDDTSSPREKQEESSAKDKEKGKIKDNEKGEKQNGKQEKGQNEKAKPKTAQAKPKTISKSKTEKQSKKKKSRPVGVSDTFKSLKSPDPPRPPEMSYTMFTKCKKKLAQADEDGYRTLDPEEYLAFVSALTSTEIVAKSFDQLPETLATPFFEFAVGDEFVPIMGAGIGQDPSVLEIERLQSFCAATFASLHYYKSPISDEQDCISSMFSGDEDLDTWLDEKEYIGFLNAWTKHRFQNYEFSGLPYVLQANYKWSRGYNGYIAIAASRLQEVPQSGIQRLEPLCERLASVISDRTPSMTLGDHCRKSIVSADVDRDGFIEKREFISLISVFTDRLWKPAKRFKAVHPVLRQFFEAKMNLDEKMDVQDARTGGSALDQFCDSFEGAVNEAQEKLSRLVQCQQSLFMGDVDGDMRLSSTEFVDMLYAVLIYPGLRDAKPDTLSFDNLHTDVQATFRSASSMKGDVDLTGFFALDVPEANKEQLQLFCDAIFDTAVPQVESEEVIVYNSFLMAGINSTVASEASIGYRKKMVNKAYRKFILSGPQTGSVADKRRRLAVLGPTPDSAKVYDVLDTECPSSYEQNATCQTFYASYRAMTSAESDPIATANALSSIAQNAIDDGALQKELISIDPDLPVKVLRASFPLTPSESLELAINRAKNASMILRTGNVMILSLSGVFALLFIVIGIFYGRRLKQREVVDAANSKLTSENLTVLGQYQPEDDKSSSDDEDMDGMTKDEKRKHLPGYSYGEDLFQYTYNRHPVLGLLWRHSLHPIGFNVRFVCLAGSMFVGFAVSNIIYITFLAFGWDFDKNYFEIAAETIAVTGKDSFDNEVMAAAATFTNGNVAIWTIGSTLHAIFDSSLWSMAACTCLAKDGFVEKIDRYSRLGSLAVSTYVVGIAVIAFASAAVRLVWTSENDMTDEPSIELAPSLGFVMSMTVEAVIAFFFFYPLLAFTMFSGLLSCLDEEYFGGRRFEMLLEQKREKREIRAQQRRKLLEERENPVEFQPQMSRDDYLMYRYPTQGNNAYSADLDGLQQEYDDDDMLAYVDRQKKSDIPSYLEESESDEASSTCNEMEFKPRNTSRRHSFGAESVSEREPVHRKWRDDHDTGSVVSAWSKSSWAKYGYDDWDEPENDRSRRSSLSRRSSSLSLEDDLPDNVLAMINEHYSQEIAYSDEESEGQDSSMTESRHSRSYNKQKLAKQAKQKKSKTGHRPSRSNDSDSGSSSSDGRSIRSSSSEEERARDKSGPKSSKNDGRKSFDNDGSSFNDDGSEDGCNQAHLKGHETSDSSFEKRQHEKRGKLADGKINKANQASKKSKNAKCDGEDSSSAGYSLSDCSSDRRQSKRTASSKSAGEVEPGDDSSNQSSISSDGTRHKTRTVKDCQSDGSISSADGVPQNENDVGGRDKSTPKKKSATNKTDEDSSSDGKSITEKCSEDTSVSKKRDGTESSDRSRDLSQGGKHKKRTAKKSDKECTEPESEKSSNDEGSYAIDDSSLDSRLPGSTKSARKTRHDDAGSSDDSKMSKQSKKKDNTDSSKSKRRGSKQAVEKSQKEVVRSDEGSDVNDESPRQSSRRRSSVDDSEDENSSASAIESRKSSKSKKQTRRGSAKGLSDKFIVEDDRSPHSTKKKRRGSSASRTKTPSRIRDLWGIGDGTSSAKRRGSSHRKLDFDDLNDELPRPKRRSSGRSLGSGSRSPARGFRVSFSSGSGSPDRRRGSAGSPSRHDGLSNNGSRRSSPNQRRQSSFTPQRPRPQGVGDRRLSHFSTGTPAMRRQSAGGVNSLASPRQRVGSFTAAGRGMSPGPNRRLSGRMQPQQGGRMQPGQRRMSTMSSGMMAQGRGMQQARGMQQQQGAGGQRRMSTMQMPQPGRGMTPLTPRRTSTMQQQGRGPLTPRNMSPMHHAQGVGSMMQQGRGGMQPGQRRMSNMASPHAGNTNRVMMQQQGRGGMPGPRRMSAMASPSPGMMQQGGQRRMSNFAPAQSPMMMQPQGQPGGARRMSNFMPHGGGGMNGGAGMQGPRRMSAMGNLQGGRGSGMGPNRPGMQQQQQQYPMGGGGRMPGGGPRRMSAMGPTSGGGMYNPNNNNNGMANNQRMSAGYVGNGMMQQQQNWGPPSNNNNRMMGQPGGAPYNNPGGQQQFRNPY